MIDPRPPALTPDAVRLTGYRCPCCLSEFPTVAALGAHLRDRHPWAFDGRPGVRGAAVLGSKRR